MRRAATLFTNVHASRQSAHGILSSVAVSMLRTRPVESKTMCVSLTALMFPSRDAWRPYFTTAVRSGVESTVNATSCRRSTAVTSARDIPS